MVFMIANVTMITKEEKLVLCLFLKKKFKRKWVSRIPTDLSKLKNYFVFVCAQIYFIECMLFV